MQHVPLCVCLCLCTCKCRQGHAGGVSCLAVSSSRELASGSAEDGTVRVWDRDRRTCTAVIEVSDQTRVLHIGAAAVCGSTTSGGMRCTAHTTPTQVMHGMALLAYPAGCMVSTTSCTHFVLPRVGFVAPLPLPPSLACNVQGLTACSLSFVFVAASQQLLALCSDGSLRMARLSTDTVERVLVCEELCMDGDEPCMDGDGSFSLLGHCRPLLPGGG